MANIYPMLRFRDGRLVFDSHHIHLSVFSGMLNTMNLTILNWWKGKPSGSIACTRKQQPRFYWSCSSVVMNNATTLTPPSALVHNDCPNKWLTNEEVVQNAWLKPYFFRHDPNFGSQVNVPFCIHIASFSEIRRFNTHKICFRVEQ